MVVQVTLKRGGKSVNYWTMELPLCLSLCLPPSHTLTCTLRIWNKYFQASYKIIFNNTDICKLNVNFRKKSTVPSKIVRERIIIRLECRLNNSHFDQYTNHGDNMISLACVFSINQVKGD